MFLLKPSGLAFQVKKILKLYWKYIYKSGFINGTVQSLVALFRCKFGWAKGGFYKYEFQALKSTSLIGSNDIEHLAGRKRNFISKTILLDVTANGASNNVYKTSWLKILEGS